MGQTVNLLANAYGGSNPPLPTMGLPFTLWTYGISYTRMKLPLPGEIDGNKLKKIIVRTIIYWIIEKEQRRE